MLWPLNFKFTLTSDFLIERAQSGSCLFSLQSMTLLVYSKRMAIARRLGQIFSTSRTRAIKRGLFVILVLLLLRRFLLQGYMPNSWSYWQDGGIHILVLVFVILMVKSVLRRLKGTTSTTLPTEVIVEQMVQSPMSSAQGLNGCVRFNGQVIEIDRESVVKPKWQSAGSGTKTIRLESLSAVQLRLPEPTIFSGSWAAKGFIEFSFSGGAESKAMGPWGWGKKNRRGWQVMMNSRNENAVIFTRKQEQDFVELKKSVNNVLLGGKSNSNQNLETRPSDRYGDLARVKELLDSGALTNEEFEREKSRILGAI